jgi:RHS repeat-associated protein
MKRSVLSIILLIASFVAFAASSDAQVAKGVQRTNSYGGGPFDTVNLGNLNVHFAVPILHKAGRGTSFGYDLTYDGTVWTPVTSGPSKSWQPSQNWGWSTPWAGTTGYITNSGTITYCYDNLGHQSGSTTTYGGYKYVDRAGTPHGFPGGLIIYAGSCTGTSVTTFSNTATDGSGLTICVICSSGTYIQTKSGDKFYPPQNPVTPVQTTQGPDHNGNKITFDPATGNFTDTLGQVALTVAGTNPVTYTYTTPGGTGTNFYNLNYSNFNVKTNFGCSGVTEYLGTNVSMVSSISLPDGTAYSFTYEPTPGFSGYYTGRIKMVTLPTGGTITYGYTGSNNGVICGDGSVAGLTRTLNPGGQWQYARTQVSGAHWQTTVTTPPDQANSGSANDVTVIDFQKDANASQSTYGFYETQRQVYQGSAVAANLLGTTVTCYNGNTTACTTTAVSSPITQTDVTLQFPNGGQQSKNETIYDAYGNVSDAYQYAYGASGPGSLLRHTAIVYKDFGSSSGIYDHPQSVTITDGSGNRLSSTTYSYDEYVAWPLQATTGTPQLTTPPSYSRGNVTTINSIVAGTSTLTRHFQYYDTGTPYKSWDVNGAVTTYTYGTATQGTSTVSCGNSFPTTVTSAPTPNVSLGLSTSYVWNCAGGVTTSTTDTNGNSVSGTFTDPKFWRPASVQDSLTNSTTFTYTAAGVSTPASVESKLQFNGANSISEQLTTLDGLGRTVLSQQQEGVGSANYESTLVTYDALGRRTQDTMPFAGTAGQTTNSAAVSTSTYDSLGRTTKVQDGGGGYTSFMYAQNDVLQVNGPAPAGENLKQKQLEYDALNRLISVCEITAGTASAPSGSCAQQTAPPSPGTGYLTTYTYDTTTISTVLYTRLTVTQNAQAASGSRQTRVYIYDLLGRLVQETNPETGNGAPGTTKYTFDSDSSGTCTGTYSGDLVKKVDNRNNITCYTYDSLHRLQDVTYAAGSPDLAITPAKHYVYDAATYSSTPMSNAKGKLAEAYTGTSASKITDEFFSYSKRGEMTDAYESTPHSGTPYYHVTAGFWANGALNLLSSNIAGLPSQTYGADGKGRPSSVTAASGQNPVTSTSYDLANYKVTANYGSLDSDVLTLDSQTGRLKSYKFNVGANSDTGTLTWNANNTLKTLAIVDTIPTTTDTQTCNYTHDDLTRVASANCGTAWNQTFAYDAFGNITKNATVGITFTPGYSSTTNQFTSLPGVTPTYDTDGRLTADGTHTYTWDAESKMHTVDTATMTYDAFGRMVEKAVGTTYTQIVYSPLGRKIAVMNVNGQTLQQGFVPLPTGSTAVYTSTGLAYYRHNDHLGSSRLASTPTRTLYSSTAYAAFGEPYKQAGTTDLSYTGQDQDTVSGMHDFLDRRYIPVQGRWLTPDPIGLAAVDPTSPQTWNRYAYVSNNPLALVDPFGDLESTRKYIAPPDPPSPPSTTPQLPPNGPTCTGNCGGNRGGVGGGVTPTPKKETNKECEANAQQKNAQAKGEARNSALKNLAGGIIAGSIINGLAGCAVGAAVGGAAGGIATALVGGEGAALGIPAGCGAGGFAAAAAGTPSVLLGAAFLTGVVYAADIYNANQQLAIDLEACK